MSDWCPYCDKGELYLSDFEVGGDPSKVVACTNLDCVVNNPSKAIQE